jgi:hypothetical protein
LLGEAEADDVGRGLRVVKGGDGDRRNACVANRALAKDYVVDANARRG